MFRRALILLPALLAVLAGPPARADYLAGWEALGAGDAAAAREAWIGDANAGDVDLQFAIGLLHESGMLGEIDREAAVAWYRAAAGRGLAAAQTRLSRMLAEGQGVEADPEMAIDLLQKAAASGYAPAQYNLAVAYQNGAGVPQDPELALQWLRRAAAQNLPQALHGLARAAMEHGGDPRQALALFRTAADAGLAEAQNDLGLLYERGEGVERDLVAAAMWYRRAAEQGFAIAQNNLGQLLQYGQGLGRNPVAAAILYRQAAEGGDPFGQINLANALANGIGLEPDLVQAYAWILIARVGDDDEAVAMASEYAERLRPQLDTQMRHAAIEQATVLRDGVAGEIERRRAARLVPLTTEELGSPSVAAQRYLKVLGYHDSIVDGIAGPGTVAAVARFQADLGLEPDGRIDERLVALLVAAAQKARADAATEEAIDAGN